MLISDSYRVLFLLMSSCISTFAWDIANSTSYYCACKLDTFRTSMEVCITRVKMEIKTGRGGDRCFRVFKDIKAGHYLGSSQADKKHKAEWYMEPVWPFISPGSTMGN